MSVGSLVTDHARRNRIPYSTLTGWCIRYGFIPRPGSGYPVRDTPELRWALDVVTRLRSLDASADVIHQALRLPPNGGPILAACSWRAVYVEPGDVDTLLKAGGWFLLPGVVDRITSV